MKIAVCDDDSQELARVSTFIDTYRLNKKAGLIYKTFQNATELLYSINSSDYDVLFLDILMPGMNGMEAAHEIRGFDKEVKIVFLTSSPEFAVESYAVKSYDYILKPVCMDKLFSILDAVIAEEQKPFEGLTVKTKLGMTRILFSNLAFIEVIGKKLYFNFADGSVRNVTASLVELEDKLLTRPEFVKVHRSYIVNLWQVEELRSKELVTHAGRSVPISRLLSAKVREAYMKHLFLQKGVE